MAYFSCPLRKKGFKGKKKEVDHVKVGYRSKKSQFQNYNTPSHSSQIANINFNSSFPARKPKPQNNQTENFPKKNYQRVQEQLPLILLSLNEMYQKLLSIGHVPKA